MFEHDLRKRIVKRKLRQNVFVRRRRPRRGLLENGKLQVFEEDLPQLLRARKIEGGSRDAFRFGFEGIDTHPELFGFAREQKPVHRHARIFHAEKDLEKRTLDFVVNGPEHLVGAKDRAQNGRNRPNGRGFFGEELFHLFARHVGPDLALRALAEDDVALRNRAGEVAGGKFREFVLHVRFDDVVHEHRVVDRAAYGALQMCEHVQRRLGVVKDLGRIRSEPRAEHLGNHARAERNARHHDEDILRARCDR